MMRLTKAKVPWGDEQERLFKKEKILSAIAQMLSHLRSTYRCSCTVMRAMTVLEQIWHRRWRMEKGWFSSRVNCCPTSKNYSVSELECLAITWVIEKFISFIECFKFCVTADHSSLSWLFDLYNQTDRLAHLRLALQGHKWWSVEAWDKEWKLSDRFRWMPWRTFR